MSTTQNNNNKLSGKLSLLNVPLDSRYDEIETPNEPSVKEIKSKCFYNTLIFNAKKFQKSILHSSSAIPTLQTVKLGPSANTGN
ncbi:hypothetical protein F53441_2715 [Fusarium austroafricanum]|uniref:Uncharacterized protein n=1 Tax=Fusarium austroafricanum TaxID=2364996 RepID=A0A8H4P0R7_9HYPO|nr:hypothetical protein F53441_2715 [Fusarium austroafricanum]